MIKCSRTHCCIKKKKIFSFSSLTHKDTHTHTHAHSLALCRTRGRLTRTHLCLICARTPARVLTRARRAAWICFLSDERDYGIKEARPRQFGSVWSTAALSCSSSSSTMSDPAECLARCCRRRAQPPSVSAVPGPLAWERGAATAVEEETVLRCFSLAE